MVLKGTQKMAYYLALCLNTFLWDRLYDFQINDYLIFLISKEWGEKTEASLVWFTSPKNCKPVA